MGLSPRNCKGFVAFPKMKNPDYRRGLCAPQEISIELFWGIYGLFVA